MSEWVNEWANPAKCHAVAAAVSTRRQQHIHLTWFPVLFLSLFIIFDLPATDLLGLLSPVRIGIRQNLVCVCLCVCPLGQKMCLRLFAFIAPSSSSSFEYIHTERIFLTFYCRHRLLVRSLFIYPSLNFSRTLYRWPFSFWLAELPPLLLLLKKRSSGFL